MSDALSIAKPLLVVLAAVAVVLIFLRLATWAMVIARLARLRMLSPGSEPIEREQIAEAERSLLESYGSELAGLGFAFSHARLLSPQTSHQTARQSALYFTSADGLTGAWIKPADNVQDGPLAQVEFCSLERSGSVLVTFNRLGYAMPGEVAGHALVDAEAGSLAAHHACHRTRIAADPGRFEAIDGARLRQLAERWSEASFQAYVECGLAHRLASGELAFNPRALPGFSWRLMQGTLRWTKQPYRLQEGGTAAASARDEATAGASAFEQMLALRDARGSAWGKAIFFVLSLAAAGVAFGLVLSWQSVPIILGVLLFHELGHYAAMQAFGYRNLSVFFIPLFGAAVAGHKDDATPMQQLTVYLAGPLPGLLLGLAMLLFGGALFAGAVPEWFREAMWMLVLLNAFNLLPIPPLDGGRIVELFVYGRLPWLRFAAVLAGAAAFGWLAWSFTDVATVALFVLVAAFVPHQFRLAQLLGGIRSERRTAGESPDAPVARAPAIQRMFAAMSQQPLARTSMSAKLGLGQLALPVLIQGVPGAWVSVAGVALYLAATVGPFVAAAAISSRQEPGAMNAMIFPAGRPSAEEARAQRVQRVLASVAASDGQDAAKQIQSRLSAMRQLNYGHDALVEGWRRENLALAESLPRGHALRGEVQVQELELAKDDAAFRGLARDVIAEFGAADASPGILARALELRGSRAGGDPAARTADLERAIELYRAPGAQNRWRLAGAQRSLALVHLEADRPADAERVLVERAAAPGNPATSVAARVDLAWFRISQGRAKEAESDLQAMMAELEEREKKAGDGARYRYAAEPQGAGAALAWARMEQQDFAGASAALQAARQSLQRSTGAWWWRWINPVQPRRPWNAWQVDLDEILVAERSADADRKASLVAAFLAAESGNMRKGHASMAQAHADFGFDRSRHRAHRRILCETDEAACAPTLSCPKPAGS